MPSSEGGIDYLPFAQTTLRKKSNRIPLEVQAAVRIQLVLTKELYGMIEYFQQKPVIGSLQGESRKPDFPSKARFNQACLGRIPAGGSHTSRRAVINSTAITGITTLPVRRMFSSSYSTKASLLTRPSGGGGRCVLGCKILYRPREIQ